MGEDLKCINCFKYLVNVISAKYNLDDEIHYRIAQATSAFGLLNKRGLTNHDLTLKTRI